MAPSFSFESALPLPTVVIFYTGVYVRKVLYSEKHTVIADKKKYTHTYTAVFAVGYKWYMKKRPYFNTSPCIIDNINWRGHSGSHEQRGRFRGDIALVPGRVFTGTSIFGQVPCCAFFTESADFFWGFDLEAFLKTAGKPKKIDF